MKTSQVEQIPKQTQAASRIQAAFRARSSRLQNPSLDVSYSLETFSDLNIEKNKYFNIFVKKIDICIPEKCHIINN